MGRRFKIWLISMVVIAVTLNLTMFLWMQIEKHYTKSLYQEVKDHDKLYVYETYYRAISPVLYVENISDTSALIEYYSKVAKHDSTATINFDLNFMRITLHEPIYVYKYLNKGSHIVQLIDFDKSCWGYLKGYVYTPTTHKSAPPDSLIQEEEAFEIKHNQDKQVQIINRIAKKISPYGWYCNN